MELRRDIATIIFDFDGTLFHLDVDWAGLLRRLGAVSVTERVGDAIQRLHLAGDRRMELVTAAELAGVGARRVDPLIAQSLWELSDGYDLAVCTRNSRQAVAQAFAGIPVGQRLCLVGREDVVHLKPHPEAFSRALANFDRTGPEVLVVGDTYHDLEAARSIGALCAIVHNERLRSRPAGADVYLAGVPDLLSLLPRGQSEPRTR